MPTDTERAELGEPPAVPLREAEREGDPEPDREAPRPGPRRRRGQARAAHDKKEQAR